jgi:hypothetical protein
LIALCLHRQPALAYNAARTLTASRRFVSCDQGGDPEDQQFIIQVRDALLKAGTIRAFPHLRSPRGFALGWRTGQRREPKIMDWPNLA